MTCPAENSAFTRQGSVKAGCIGLHIVCLILLAFIGTACGVDPLGIYADTAEVLVGKDSAGATVEIEKQGDDLLRARVIDIVLGTGENSIVQDDSGQVSFTIEFPAGVSVTYVGSVGSASKTAPDTIEGTWTQNPNGIFGSDTGTWQVTPSPE